MTTPTEADRELAADAFVAIAGNCWAYHDSGSAAKAEAEMDKAMNKLACDIATAREAGEAKGRAEERAECAGIANVVSYHSEAPQWVLACEAVENAIRARGEGGK